MSGAFESLTDRWREELVTLGFSDDGERLRGAVQWTGPDGKEATARVQITPTATFPFAPPQVRILDAGALFEPTFHVDEDGVPCLWEDEHPVDQAPWRDPAALLTRITDWMELTATGWPDDDSTDFERYLAQDLDTFVVYDASSLVLNAAVRVQTNAAPGTVTITNERRQLRSQPGGRQRRRDKRLAWAADIGTVTLPLRGWTDVAAALGPRATEVTRLITFGAVSLLLLRYDHGGAPGALALRVGLSPTGIQVAACESADTSAATRGLRAGANAHRLADSRVAVVGCGAIGSFTADLLFRSGVRHLTLIDGERLRPGNVVRHLAGVEHVGLLKTRAVGARLAEVDPDVSKVMTRGPLVDLEDAINLIQRHDVVLDATGSARASSLLATAADRAGHMTGHAVVSVCVQRAGEVLRVDRMPLRRSETYLPALPLLQGVIGRREHGCGSPVSPTPPGAVIAAAELAHRVVMDQVTRDCTLPPTIADVRAPQPEPPFDVAGLITSAPTPCSAVS